MKSLNRYTCIGFLTSDVDIKNAGNLLIARGGVAMNRKGKEKDTTTFINFKIFGALVESIGTYLRKGSLVYLSGYLDNNNYKKDNKEVYSLEFVVDNVILLDRAEKQEKAQQEEEVKQEDKNK